MATPKLKHVAIPYLKVVHRMNEQLPEMETVSENVGCNNKLLQRLIDEINVVNTYDVSIVDVWEAKQIVS